MDSATTTDHLKVLALESVLCTEELNRRPTRPPDHEMENRALISLAEALADAPRTILQTLADTILTLFQCDSAGVSLVTEDGTRFYWPAIAGKWQPYIGGGTPRDFSPCGDVLDRNSPLLFRHFERRYTYFLPVTPPVEECLLAPFYVERKAVGTIWAITHDDRPGARRFDNEDLRILVSLGTFASAAYQSVEQLHAFTEQTHERQKVAQSLREMNEALLVSSVRLHELAEQAQKAEAALRASELRYRRLFESAKDGLLILDAHTGKITDCNACMGGLIGTESHELLGKELWEIGLFRNKSENEAALRELQQHGYVRCDHLPLKTKSGQQAEVEFVSNVYQVDHRSIAQCNIRDISERSRLERQTKGQAAELSDLHRRKDEFLAMLSHELRNPIAAITNAVHLLGLDHGAESLIQHQARSIIERQMGQLNHLIDDLLEVSRITTGRVQLRRERIAVGGIVEVVAETVRPQIEQHRHHFTISLPSEPIWVYADAARLEQVVVNLLTNAAKYTAEGGQISLIVEQEGNECVLRVRDTGVGIDPVLLPRIFDLFTQAERSLDRSQGGLGIGLALVQRLTELHGGRVEAYSALGQGSEFVVRLPVELTLRKISEVSETLEASSVPAAIQPAEPGRAKATARVLMVDDSVDFVESMAIMLRLSGFDVRTAHTGPAALEAAIAFEPEVVFLDIGLPEMNGYEVARHLREQPKLKNVRLVALTGYGQESDLRRAQVAGFDVHLVKPVGIQKLQDLLATLLPTPTKSLGN